MYKTISQIYKDFLDYIDNNPSESNEFFEYSLKFLEIRLKFLDKNHRDLITSYNHTAHSYEKHGQHEEALKFYLEALEIEHQILGENHPDLGITYNCIAAVYDHLKQSYKALEYYKKTLQVKLYWTGENSFDAATSYYNIGTVYGDIQQYDMAFAFLKKALKIFIETYHDYNPHVVALLRYLINYAKKASQFEIITLHEVPLICAQISDEKHPLVQELSQLIEKSQATIDSWSILNEYEAI